MPAPLRIILTAEEDRTLAELRMAQNLPQRIRHCAITVLQISNILRGGGRLFFVFIR